MSFRAMWCYVVLSDTPVNRATISLSACALGLEARGVGGGEGGALFSIPVTLYQTYTKLLTRHL
jgi:hypothetical protein